MKITISEKQLKHITSFNEELDEQESSPSTSSTSTGDGAPPSSTTAGAKKWESGVVRGPANQIDDKTKWSDIVGSKVTRGKANPLW